MRNPANPPPHLAGQVMLLGLDRQTRLLFQEALTTTAPRFGALFEGFITPQRYLWKPKSA